MTEEIENEELVEEEAADNTMKYVGIGCAVIFLFMMCIGVIVGAFYFMGDGFSFGGRNPNHDHMFPVELSFEDDDLFEYEVYLEEDIDYEFLTFDLGDCADTVLVLYDEDGDQITYNDDGGRGLASRLEYTPRDSGNYIIEILPFSSYSEDNCGTFSFELTP